jgi:dephospho-CoA kinase
MKRNSLTEEQAINRIDAQLPLEIKVKYANYIIDTSGSIDDTRAQTFSIIQELLKNNRNT